MGRNQNSWSDNCSSSNCRSYEHSRSNDDNRALSGISKTPVGVEMLLCAYHVRNSRLNGVGGRLRQRRDSAPIIDVRRSSGDTRARTAVVAARETDDIGADVNILSGR